MARYGAEMNRTASTTLACGVITANAGTPRRVKIYDLVFGSEATPADNAFLWKLTRCTDAGTSTAVTARPLDPADAAATCAVGENITVAPTTAGLTVLAVALNQRASFRWVAAPYSELVIPATASNGFVIETPTATGLVAITSTAMFNEE